MCLLLSLMIFFFFFSSRRLHTRSYGDWSSDVCSSDLRLSFEWPPLSGGGYKICAVPKIGAPSIAALSADPKLPICSRRDRGHESAHRSEERRVGKECRPL